MNPSAKWAPVIPMVSADCPTWQNDTITFMGLAGIKIEAGSKPATPTAPMLVYWHGTASTSDEYATMAAPIANGVTQAGGVIVSFQGTTGGDLSSGNAIFGQGDLNVVDGLVACAVRDHNVDTRRIYTTGCGAGGVFAVSMAAMRSAYVAAVAPNSGGTVQSPSFENDHTPPLMTVHGAPSNASPIIDPTQEYKAADALFESKRGFVIDCDTGAGFCSGKSLAGDVWEFFQAHPFGVDPEPWASGLPAGFSSQCKIQ
jgi:dienelactone hydrolase